MGVKASVIDRPCQGTPAGGRKNVAERAAVPRSRLESEHGRIILNKTFQVLLKANEAVSAPLQLSSHTARQLNASYIVLISSNLYQLTYHSFCNFNFALSVSFDSQSWDINTIAEC